MSPSCLQTGISYLVHTIVSASIAESYAVRKWLRSNPGKTLKDAYAKDGVITYRNIVMCPGHLVEKWASEVEREVPYAKVQILNDFTQLLEIRKRGRERKTKEWYFISKDFGKLSYQSEPTPKRRRHGRLKTKVCEDCGETYNIPGHTCPKCGSREYRLEDSGDYGTGMVCPHCNQILLQNKTQTKLGVYDQIGPKVLDHADFTAQNNSNSHCYYCENELWQPHVANIGGADKHKPWIRATHYSNKAHKGTKTVWVHKKYMSEYFTDIVHEQPLNILDGYKGNRKYSPVEFIKRYLRGFFDIAVFDEAHLYKGGTTGQGHAMHALIKASKKQLALTGTIAGGYANHLYYLLWRLEPQRMVKRGYRFDEELRFAEDYGKVEKTYEYSGGADAEGNYNASCKGRQKSTPKVKPGISPMIFMDYLLDRTTFLDLTDMSKYLPALKENVVLVEPEDGPEQIMIDNYKDTIKALTEASRDKVSGGKGILSTMLQFSLSYPDKPFGVSPIKSPRSGHIICRPDDFKEFMDINSEYSLLSKEKKLIEIVKSEIAEGRNCFVYAEYTGSPETCITGRLQAIIEKYCNLEGKVAVLESSSPKASERERWIHKMAAKGVQVFITNPKCTETGLDFCFKEDGVTYNYPTIIFYQLGYSLFTIWQASRRHYRLNQTRECRTYYLAWQNTIQQTVISLIAEKQAATSAIQGRFSAEGLSAMANGTDARMRLAQSLSEMDTTSKNELQEMFDVLADTSGDDCTYDTYKPMLLFKELVDNVDNSEVEHQSFDEMKMEEINDLFILDLFDFNNIAIAQSNMATKTDDDVIEEVVEVAKSSGRKKKTRNTKVVAGQMSFF